MKFHRAALSILLPLSLMGCGTKDFSGKTLNTLLNPPKTQCKVTAESEPVSQNDFEKIGRKVILDINGGSHEAASGFQTTSLNQSPILSKGTKLDIVVNEPCVLRHRQDGTERELTQSLDLVLSPSPEMSHAIELEQDMTLADLDYEAEKDECVVGINDSRVAETFDVVPNDPQFAQQEHHLNIKSSIGWDTFYNSSTGIKREIVIAVIDTGVELNHSDLKDNIWMNTNETPGNGVDDDGNGYTDDVNGYNFASNKADPNPEGSNQGHGTHVAGLAAARHNNGVGVVGVNGAHVKIMVLNVFGNQTGAGTSNIDRAIRYAADNGAHVINMSLGAPGDVPEFSTAIQYAISKGTFVAIAAGNDNQPTSGYSPARYGGTYIGAVAVAAIDSVSSAKCGFSNFGVPTTEIAAPGCKAGSAGVLSTLLGSSYGRLQGTSMASPVTAGVASLAYGLLLDRSTMTRSKAAAEEVERLLLAGSRVETGLMSTVKDGKAVDLAVLASTINSRYPAGGGATPTPTPAPCP